MFLQGEKISDIKSACFIVYADYLHRNNNNNKAIIFYERAIRFNFKNIYAYEGLAMSLVVNRSFAQALKTCKQAISIRPTELLYILLIIIYKCLEQPILAEDAMNNTLKFFDNNKSVVYDRLAYSYWLLNMFDNAEYYCKESLQLNPDESSIHYHLASVYSAKQEFEMAIQEYKKVIKLTSDKKYIKNSQKEIEKNTRWLINKEDKHM